MSTDDARPGQRQRTPRKRAAASPTAPRTSPAPRPRLPVPITGAVPAVYSEDIPPLTAPVLALTEKAQLAQIKQKGKTDRTRIRAQNRAKNVAPTALAVVVVGLAAALIVLGFILVLKDKITAEFWLSNIGSLLGGLVGGKVLSDNLGGGGDENPPTSA